jgi:uncharacterized YccA/Bax inhibitor family protein
MANPVLNDAAFKRASGTGVTTLPPPDISTRVGVPAATAPAGVMTVNGTLLATMGLLALLIAAAIVGWQTVTVEDGEVTRFPGWSLILILVGFGAVIGALAKPTLAKFLGPLYAVLEGVFLGAISHAYDAQWNGIVLAAVGATLGVFSVMLLLYYFRIIKVTDRLRSIIIGATFGLMLFYLVAWVTSWFGAEIGIINSPSLLGIGFSVLAAGLAAFNLLLDFDFIERGSRSQAPAHMNWVGALGLVVTVVWLYLEMLRLLSKLQR